jgi:hypothetical protein
MEIAMNEAKFTKGDWRVERFVNNKGFEIAFNDDGEVVADYVYEESDAHLIAAAPDMYDAMQELVDRVERGEVRSVKTYHKFKAILTKARGG